MIITVTDVIQSTAGPLGPMSIPVDTPYLYTYNTVANQMSTAAFNDPQSIYVNSAMLLELSSRMYAIIPWDYDVLLADGDTLPAHELTTGTALAYFTRVMRHEKYSAMRVTPFMSDRELEHRFVWEQHHHMDVPHTHTVDHIDGDSYNNHYLNLRALDIRSHSRMTAQRQRNRHTARNADGSFKKGSSERIASAPKPIPERLSTGKVTGPVRIVSMEEAELDNHFFSFNTQLGADEFAIMGNLLVQPMGLRH